MSRLKMAVSQIKLICIVVVLAMCSLPVAGVLPHNNELPVERTFEQTASTTNTPTDNQTDRGMAYTTKRIPVEREEEEISEITDADEGEGEGDIRQYPWLGVLTYPRGKVRLTSVVVLVTPQLLVGSAHEIHRLPKNSFRKNARVVLGQNCSAPGFKVLDYTYHPHFMRRTFSTLVLIQLDLSEYQYTRQPALKPIRGPPDEVTATSYYAIVLSQDCRKSQLKLYEMDHVSMDTCKRFYEKHGLDSEALWPARGVCGAARGGARACLWDHGAVLLLRQNARWHLMGYGVSGPGCGAAARFVDYTHYHDWVVRARRRMGWPSVTRLDEDQLIIRMARDRIQRFGRCDVEESVYEIYTDTHSYDNIMHVTHTEFNLTLYTEIDYSCVRLICKSVSAPALVRPRMALRVRCDAPRPVCYSATAAQISFFIDLYFDAPIIFKLAVYGRRRPLVDHHLLTLQFNQRKPRVTIPYPYDRTYTRNWKPAKTQALTHTKPSAGTSSTKKIKIGSPTPEIKVVSDSPRKIKEEVKETEIIPEPAGEDM